jgi:N-carbamoyl-L-amino-acid hydrolase
VARNLTIDAERLWGDLMDSARFGGTAKGGICRLTLSEADREVRDWFKAAVERLGLAVTIDDMGSMFARRAGQRDVPPIALGSHLDTQPTGGKFDGVLGVLAALEAVRTLTETGYQTFAPIEVVNWTNEEGSRFAPGMLASGVFAGAFAPDWAGTREDRAGVKFADALDAIGYRGGERAGDHPLAAYFELHIEQGPILEARGEEIGVVTGIQGVDWFEVTVTGQDSHTGTTPMHLRKNALIGAARMVERVDAIARAHAPAAVGTVGLVEVKPNSRNVIPGEVFFTVDFRHPDDSVLATMQRELEIALEEVCRPLELQTALTKVLDQRAVRFNTDCVDAVRRAAASCGFSHREMIAGASHDAAYLARVCPTAMIFVPSRGGISHNEAEFSSKEQCAAGAQVLLQAALDYDRRLAERHGAAQ